MDNIYHDSFSPKCISSQEQLDSIIASEGTLECYISLNFKLRSSKEISLTENGDYYVYNECDGSEEIINHGCLMDSFIGRAITQKSLYKY